MRVRAGTIWEWAGVSCPWWKCLPSRGALAFSSPASLPVVCLPCRRECLSCGRMLALQRRRMTVKQANRGGVSRSVVAGVWGSSQTRVWVALPVSRKLPRDAPSSTARRTTSHTGARSATRRPGRGPQAGSVAVGRPAERSPGLAGRSLRCSTHGETGCPPSPHPPTRR